MGKKRIEKTIKTAIIGLGGRGLGLLKGVILHMRDVEIVAVCDLYPDRAKAGADSVFKKRGMRPLETTDYKEALAVPGVEAVVVSTSWEDHIKIAVYAMEMGIYVGMEVGGAYSLDDCFKLVECYEKTKTPCMLLENCCYGEYELLVSNMVKQGIFGEIVHCSGGYCHDLRYEIAYGKENRHYRLRNYLTRNCENYPTHELGPICQLLNVNNGNRLLSLMSISSKACGMKEYIKKKKPDDKELNSAEFKQGDIVTTIIKCQNGETIELTLDTTLPRFYSRGFTVHGTKALYQEDGNIMFVDGKDNFREFMPRLLLSNAKRYRRRYRHPIWKQFKKEGVRGGHGGMDWLVFRDFFDACQRRDGTMPIDVYDTALWMSITPLSEESIKTGLPVEIPDFKNRTV